MEATKAPQTTPPKKSKKAMYGIVGAVVIIVVVVLALYLGGYLTSTPTPPSSTASDKIYDNGTCSTSSNCGYTPSPLNIAANTQVSWTSNSSQTHTVTECVSSSPSGSCPNKDPSALSPTFDSGISTPIAANCQTSCYSYTFKTAGTYYYYCQIHSWMHGQIVVSS